MTLIEVVVSAAILSLITVSFLSMFTHSITGWSSGTSRDTANNKAALALQRLANDVRDAKSAQAVSGVLAVTFPIKITDLGNGETVYDLGGSDPIVRYYYISNGNLVRTAGGSTVTLAKGITSITFGGSGGTVSVTLTASDQVGRHTNTETLTGRITLRNFRS